ncbi:MAG TPA: 23S rRNA (pseudouridine(1915)-N(3))-methyltransferase RlmH [Blastocatellia bacterium]|nr:23S rRNA (pseudouridine(1915)-N(3))-methyltransferase RlmH [Blastocatellia bacterium]
MYKLSVIAVGSLKETFWKEAISEYAKRLAPYAKIQVIETAESSYKTPSEAATVMRAEAEGLKKRLPDGAFVVALVKEGRALTTEAFAETLRREGEGGREIAFLIGGPLGLDPVLAASAHLKLSLSSMTFTHGEARAVLFEQMYRAMTVLAGKIYHL